ncbi:MAG: leucine-rich repeat domain-containing protein [Alphaproteobacteria bacterium]|nr:leucine-rich repeat domain-containing protein [Alphaproteobacteria bacterium]
MKKTVLILAILASFNANAWEACGTDAKGNTANCEYQIVNGTLTIRGTGNNGNIGSWSNGTGILAPWRGQDIRNIVIEDTIKDLGWQAFHGIKDEGILQIPSSITTISANAFYGAILNEVVIPDSVTKIDTAAFNWSDLKKINIPSSVTDIAEAFRGTSLTDVFIPDSVTNLGSATLSACESLLTLTISDKTALGHIFTEHGENMRVDLENLKIYCTGDTKKCDANLEAAGYGELKSIKATTKQVNGVTYVFDNKGKLVTTSGKRENRRFYTIEEASLVSKKTGNTFKLRYK